MDVITEDDLADFDEEYDEELRQERAHRYLERETALGFRAVQRKSGLVVVSRTDEDDDEWGQYL